jgi:phosphoserine phosphatase RsbU/P
VKLRQVRFPLKFKLLAVMIVLISSCLVVFLAIALQIFQEDKRAYLFETLLNKATASQIILGQKLDHLSRDDQPAFDFSSGKLKLSGTEIDQFLEQELLSDAAHQLRLVVPTKLGLLEWTPQGTRPVPPEEAALLNPALEHSVSEAVREVQIGDEVRLYAYAYDPIRNFMLMTSLSHDEAYAVTRYLVHKSMFYGLFILGVAMVLSVLLARPLTAQLERLLLVTQDIARGDFTSRARIAAQDEVGALSDSVNDMAEKIVVYMEEMKEKARLANEVAVAQLVQASFFPPTHQRVGKLEFFGHYEPATECGGDWWGVHEQGDWKIFFIADATGHGVPAALLTATINCCKSSLGFIMEQREDLATQPSEILRYMNQAVCGAGNEIQVTCFIASYNQRTHELFYANSSHNPPLLYPAVGENLTKESFRPLMEANGPRLGQNPTSAYEQQGLTLGSNDTILFYTDGLIEAENTEGTRWGERRLLKTMIQHGQAGPEELIKGIVSGFKEHVANLALQDDFTVVAMRVSE